jgi:hypothetical protein
MLSRLVGCLGAMALAACTDSSQTQDSGPDADAPIDELGAGDADGDRDGDAPRDELGAGDADGEQDDADACDPEAGCCSASDCDDGADCTDDRCDPATRSCANVFLPGWCRIAGACRADGELNPDDPCLECRASADTAAWTAACTYHLTDTTFEDFRDGTFPRSAGDLYVSGDGAVRWIRAGDLDGNGYLDIVFSNHHDDGAYRLDSYVYWGSVSGFSTDSRTALPTIGAIGNTVADLDADGFLDLVFSNFYDGTTTRLDSYVYWGSAAGFSAAARTALPTLGSHGNTAADFDADGHLDVVFTSFNDDRRWRVDAYVYWGSDAGFSTSDREALPVMGAELGTTADFGNVYDRTPDETYRSGPIDLGAGHSLARLGRRASLPLDCAVRLRLRSAATAEELGSAAWYGPTSTTDWYTGPAARVNAVHAGHRWVQYEAVLSSPTFRAAPALDSVTLGCE